MKKLGLVILIVLTMATFAFAQADIGLKAIGGKVGYVMPEGSIENTIGLGVVADLGAITDAIHLDAIIEYWGKSYGVGSHWDWTYTNIIIGGIGKYYFEMDAEFKPYAGAGLGLVIGSVSSDYSGPYSEYYTDTSESNTDLFLVLCGGADYPLSDSMTGFAELKYTIGGIDYFAIFAGVKFAMGN